MMKPLHEHHKKSSLRDKGMIYHAGRYPQHFAPCGEYADKTQFNSARPGAKAKLRRARKSKQSSARHRFKLSDAAELLASEPND